MASLSLAFDILARDKASQTFDKVGDAADRTGGKVSGFGSHFADLGKKVAIGAAALGVGAVAIGKGLIEAAVESQKVTAQTEAVIKSMGGVANVSAKQVANLAESLAMKTGVDDEVIQSGQNVLLTFGNVQNAIGDGPKIFDRATQAALDMSVALGQDMSSASMMVGKALNDPIDGISKLSRSGIQFTDEQKEQIKTMQEAGDIAGAQAVMLAELERQFGGSAEAQATAGDRLKVVWGNLQETLGEKLLPVFEAVASFLAKNLPGAMERAGAVIGPIARTIFGGLKQVFDILFKRDFTGGPFAEDSKIVDILFKFRDGVVTLAPIVRDVLVGAFKGLANIITNTVIPAVTKVFKFLMDHKEILVGIAAAIAVGLVAAFVSWATAAAAAAAATIAAAAPVIAIGAAIAALVAGVIYAYQHWGWFRDAVDAVASFITGTLWPVLQNVAGWITGTLIPTIGSIIATFLDWGGKVGEVAGTIIGYVAGIIDWVKANWPTILAVLTGPIGLAVLAITKNWDTIKEGVTGVKDWIVEKFDAVVSFVTGMPDRVETAAKGLFDGIKDAFKSAINWVIRAWNNLEFRIPGFDPPGPGPKFDGFTLGMPDIPELHMGGRVTATGIEPLRSDEVLAKLKVGETVYPQGMAGSVDQSRHVGQLVVQTTASPRAWIDEFLWQGAGL